MELLPGINMESRLVSLECDAIAYLGAKHHLGALHEVVHDVLQSWLKSLLVD